MECYWDRAHIELGLRGGDEDTCMYITAPYTMGCDTLFRFVVVTFSIELVHRSALYKPFEKENCLLVVTGDF